MREDDSDRFLKVFDTYAWLNAWRVIMVTACVVTLIFMALGFS